MKCSKSPRAWPATIPSSSFVLDYLKQPLAAMPKIRRFLETHQYVTAIATCRRADNGGKFKGSLASQLEVLNKAQAAGCQIVDLELESALKTKPEVLARLRKSAGVIVSFHDFRATRNLEATLEKMLKVPADFYKIVTTATTLSDNVTMMKFLQTHSDKHALIGLCMGEQGIISRVLSVRAGSVFTFGAVSAELKTAPGQVSARDLRSIYRIEQVDAATRVYGVAGDPIEHSLSPVIMNTALRRENVNGVYVAAARQDAQGSDPLRARNPPARLERYHAVQAGDPGISRQHRCAHREDRSLQYGRARAGRQTFWLQHRCCGSGASARAAADDRGCEGSGAGRRWRGPRRRLRSERARRGSLDSESHRRQGAETRAPGQSARASSAPTCARPLSM